MKGEKCEEFFGFLKFFHFKSKVQLEVNSYDRSFAPLLASGSFLHINEDLFDFNNVVNILIIFFCYFIKI